MEGIILTFVALGALIAFGAGIVLLVLYMRSGREDQQELVRYGNLVQCPRCGYMNPADSAACLNCRLPFGQQRQPVPPAAAPNYPTIPPAAACGAAAAQPTAPPAAYQPPAAPRPTPLPKPYTPPAGATVRRAIESEPAPSPAPSPTPSPVAPPVAQPAAARTSSEMPQAWLEHVAGPGVMEPEPLTQTDTMVGRSTVCDIQVPDPKVSRKHFQIRYGNGAFFLQDQQSSRGTYINGERVIARRLADGDRINVGDTTLRFHVE